MNKTTMPRQRDAQIHTTTTRVPAKRHATSVLPRPIPTQRVTPVAQAKPAAGRINPVAQPKPISVNNTATLAQNSLTHTGLHSAGSIGFSSSTLSDEPLPANWLIRLQENWPILRSILVIWAIGVWLLLIMLPGVEQISNATSAMLTVPHIFIGLGLLVSMFVAYNLKLDAHFLWFLSALLLLAGWM